MSAGSKRITKISKCDTSTSVSSKETKKRNLKHTKRKLELLTSDSADEISESNAICGTELQPNNTNKKSSKSNIVPKLSDDKKNPTEDISQLTDEMMFENIDSSLKDDLCLKLKSKFEITKVTKKGTNAKIRKKPESAKIKSKEKATIKKDKLNEGVSETKVKLNRRNIQKKNYSEETTEEPPSQFSCDEEETPQSFIKEASSREENTENILDIPLSCILSHIKTKVKDPESLQILSKHWINKLNNVIISAAKYKERCGRENLTVDDFRKGLLFCGEKPKLEFLDIPEENKKEKPINILSVSKNKTKSKKVSILPKPKPNFNKEWLEHNPLSKDLSELPDELEVYFQLVTKAFLNAEEPSCSAALEDLKINKNISYLVPSFVDFISSEIKRKCSEVSSMSVILRVMQSLLLNPCLHFAHDSYLNVFAYLLLKCLLDPLQHFHLNCDFLMVKDNAAELLALVLKRSKSKKLWFEMVFVLEVSFCDVSKSFVSHYGTVAAVNSIGVSAITLVILPHIKDYFKHLNSVDTFDYQKKCNAYAVQSQLIRTYYLLISHFVKYDFIKSHSGETQSNLNNVLKRKIFEAVSNNYFSEYFGDALVQHFPLQSIVSYSTTDGKIIKKNSILKAKDTSIKVKVQNKTRHWLPYKVDTNNVKPVNKLRDIMFDCVPLKKHTIKFGELMEKT